MKTILALLLIITAHNSFADGLYTGAWSYHFNRDEWREKGWELNENNQLIGYKYGKVAAGHYYNSFGDSTVMLNIEIAHYQYGDFRATIYGGASYGYSFCDGGQPKTMHDPKKVCPGLLPEFRYTKYSIHPTFLIIGKGVAASIFWNFD